MTLERCSIPDEMNLESAELPFIDLSGSYTGPISAMNLIVHGNLNFSSADPNRGEFNASGLVNLMYAKVEGWANFADVALADAFGFQFPPAYFGELRGAEPQIIALSSGRDGLRRAVCVNYFYRHFANTPARSSM
jgi:hypothetical protein